ncbi:GAF domain-containing protein [Stenomitos frigidus]|uniref:Chemotaxis protein n=1 Tax=Stenomitos frigidus ULC18 TaxID=2107698 RepID=A0A2T1ECI4_9CYAN|nr:GAF domain-containing protein [Stenomitos frigidus]PSB30418.1 chemotaxis protein [Stenomitos frigidus ULC18]
MVNRIDPTEGLDSRNSLQTPANQRNGDLWEQPQPSDPPSDQALEAVDLLPTPPLVKRRPFLIQLFCNLPIGRKQMLALVVCELVPILGLGAGSALVLTSSLRTQLLEQAKSEVAVTETHYNIKINQMGYGSRGQADNTAMISVARTQSQGGKPNADLNAQVRQLLRNEVTARKMEYATLVDKDARIVVNANADRQGETFNPAGLVSKVLKTSVQIKASAIVPWSELAKEAPSLPNGFSKQDTLIRYVVTPVKDPETKAVIGALVFGDVVNAKRPIVEETLNALGNGYSAVYARKLNGEFTLATALNKVKAADVGDANLALPKTSLLEQAAAAKGRAVTQRLEIGDHTYTVAAKAVPVQNRETPDGTTSAFDDQSAAILVRGTLEDGVNGLIASSLRQDLLVLALTLLVVTLWTAAFRRLVLRPLENLEQATQSFANGDRTQRAQVSSLDEVGQLTIAFNAMADSIVQSEAALSTEARQREVQAQQSELLSNVVVKIRQTLNLDDIVQTGVDEIREFLGADRVLIYRFNDGYESGTITAESAGSGWIRALGQTIYDPLVEGAIDRYKSGRVWYTTDISKGNLSRCHCEILERLQVKANIVAPIKVNGELMGLVCAHQCASPRDWRPSDIDFFAQLAIQLGYALDQADLLRQQEIAAKQARQLNEITLRMRETLDPQQIYKTALKSTRDALGADRTLIYLFDERWQGTIIAESVAPGFPVALGARIADPCFAQNYVEKYRKGRVQATANIYDAGLTDCYLGQLEPFQVKANLVVPILVEEKLLGLLIAHQCSAPRQWQESEINFFQQVSIQLSFALEQANLLQQSEAAAKFDRLLNEITSRMRETLDPQQIYKATLKGTRDALGADRTLIYLFDERWQGTIIAESVVPGFPVALGAQITDPCFAKDYVEQYRQGRVQATTNIHAAGLTACHLEQLEPFQVQANLVVPILVEEKLLGLLIAHQCSAPRQWQEGEINFFQQVAVQLSFALEQAQLFAQREQAILAAEALSEEQQQKTETLQMQLLQLLSDIEGAASGDLTVRAEVTAGEIGTVADFFNSIVESLRQIVTQVKTSALEVNASLGQNEHAIQQLAEEASKQAAETTRTLDSVEQMASSIQTVATNARQAAAVTRSAASTAEAGEDAMDLTVQNILALRDTIGETAKKVKRLGESSQQISKVVSLINQIALQTNLLAINAGIEAARAGEQGQGFAVVAEEVGELAARSAIATQEIEQIVNTIQRETGEVVEAMALGTTQVVEGTRLVGDAKQSLVQLLEVSRQIDTLVQSIFNATVSQTQTSDAIATLMRDVVQVSERTFDSSQQVSNSLRQTVEVAHELQESVGTFKVG